MFDYNLKKFGSSNLFLSLTFLLIFLAFFPIWEPTLISAGESQVKVSLHIAQEVSSSENEKLGIFIKQKYSVETEKDISLILTDY